MFQWSSARSDALLESPQALLPTVTTMGYCGFLAGPPFSSPQAPIDRDALSSAKGRPGSNPAPAAARTARFSKTPHRPALSPWTRPLFGSKLLVSGGTCDDSQRDSKTGLCERGATLYDPRGGIQ